MKSKTVKIISIEENENEVHIYTKQEDRIYGHHYYIRPEKLIKLPKEGEELEVQYDEKTHDQELWYKGKKLIRDSKQ